MKKQKITSQMKEQDKIPEKQLNEVEIGNLPEPGIEPRCPALQASALTSEPPGKPHPLADNWIKAFLSKALHTRAKPSFSNHQSLPSRSLHEPLSLLHQRADKKQEEAQSHSS